MQNKLGLLDHLRQSVELGFVGFSLQYQPLIRMDKSSLYGCEALLRWSHPDFPQGVTPCDFVPILEESGLMIQVGNWVLESAVKQCAHWGKKIANFHMNINVASMQFEKPDFKFFIMDLLAKYGVSPSSITLELTESGKVRDPREMQQIFDFIRGQGIKIAFDDFGTGYASLGLFRVLSADELKIDRSFLERISYDVTDQKIITQLVNLCHSMNMNVCVEGVETQELESIVKQFEPDFLQGYYFNQPMDVVDFEHFYFDREPVASDPVARPLEPERSWSMVYAPFRPAQPMSMKEVVDNVHAGILEVGMDHEFTLLTCNEGYRRMLGYTAQEMDGRFKNRALGFVHPDDARYVNEEIRRQLSLGDTVTIEFRVVKSNGESIWILGTGNVVKSRHGGVSLIVVIIDNDRIKRKKLKEEAENQDPDSPMEKDRGARGIKPGADLSRTRSDWDSMNGLSDWDSMTGLSERDGMTALSDWDSMTGLLNKGAVEKQVRNVLSHREQERQYALYIIDMDDFKTLNDWLGHRNGDLVICEMASRMQTILQDEAIIGRVGGDEFLICTPYVGGHASLVDLTEQLIACLHQKIILEKQVCFISVSVGISCCPDDGTEFYDLFQLAESALHRAKELGKNTYCFAAPKTIGSESRRMEIKE